MAEIRYPVKERMERMVKQSGKSEAERYSSTKQGKTQLIKTYPNQTHGV
jgi:hypothetical protein